MRLVDPLFVSVQVISNYFIWVTDNPLLQGFHNDIRGSLLNWLSCYLPPSMGRWDFPFVQRKRKREVADCFRQVAAHKIKNSTGPEKKETLSYAKGTSLKRGQQIVHYLVLCNLMLLNLVQLKTSLDTEKVGKSVVLQHIKIIRETIIYRPCHIIKYLYYHNTS